MRIFSKQNHMGGPSAEGLFEAGGKKNIANTASLYLTHFSP